MADPTAALPTPDQLSPRLKVLREQALAWANDPDPLERGRAVIRAYRRHATAPVALRRAHGVREYLLTETLTLDDGDLLVGRLRRAVPVHAGIHQGHAWVRSAMFPELQVNLRELAAAGLPEAVQDEYRRFAEEFPSPLQAVWAGLDEATALASRHGLLNVGAVDGNHRLPRFQLVLDQGFGGLRAATEARLAELPGDDPRRDQLAAVRLVYETASDYCRRWAERLRELAVIAAGPARRDELTALAGICDRLATEPPATFVEALQLVHLVMVINQAETPGTACSMGRLDQYLWPYFTADRAAGRLSRDQALELIEAFFLKYHRTFDHHHTCLAGLTPTGEDGTNELSYLCLEATAALRTPRNIAVRIHDGTPREFLELAVAVAGLGLGRPDLWSDEVTIEALLAKGFPLADARDYAPIGCVELTVPGKCNSRTMGHAINLAKALELALHGGRCSLTGDQVVPPSELEFADYEALHAAYRRQASRAIRLAIEEAARQYRLQAETLPMPVLSAFTVGCPESGRDVMAGGAVYNPAGVNLFAVSQVADSLAAIRELVFERGQVSLAELREALATDFVGRERLHQLLLHGAPKFGNDCPAVDTIAAAEAAFYCAEVSRYQTPEGGPHLPLIFGVTANAIYSLGPRTGASADGRRAGAPLATSVNPTCGLNLAGLTAELNSVSRIDFRQVAGGVSYIVDLHPSLLNGRVGACRVADAIRVFFAAGGMEIGLNVLSEADLREAQADPASYQHVMVRVFGFSTQFVSLEPEFQEYVIEKSRHRS